MIGDGRVALRCPVALPWLEQGLTISVGSVRGIARCRIVERRRRQRDVPAHRALAMPSRSVNPKKLSSTCSRLRAAMRSFVNSHCSSRARARSKPSLMRAGTRRPRGWRAAPAACAAARRSARPASPCAQAGVGCPPEFLSKTTNSMSGTCPSSLCSSRPMIQVSGSTATRPGSCARPAARDRRRRARTAAARRRFAVAVERGQASDAGDGERRADGEESAPRMTSVATIARADAPGGEPPDHATARCCTMPRSPARGEHWFEPDDGWRRACGERQAGGRGGVVFLARRRCDAGCCVTTGAAAPSRACSTTATLDRGGPHAGVSRMAPAQASSRRWRLAGAACRRRALLRVGAVLSCRPDHRGAARRGDARAGVAAVRVVGRVSAGAQSAAASERFHESGVQHADLNAHNIVLGTTAACTCSISTAGGSCARGAWEDAVLARLIARSSR